MSKRLPYGTPQRTGQPIPVVERVHLSTTGSMTYNEWCSAARSASAMMAHTRHAENAVFYREKARRYASVARAIRATFPLRSGVFYAVTGG